MDFELSTIKDFPFYKSEISNVRTFKGKDWGFKYRFVATSHLDKGKCDIYLIPTWDSLSKEFYEKFKRLCNGKTDNDADIFDKADFWTMHLATDIDISAKEKTMESLERNLEKILSEIRWDMRNEHFKKYVIGVSKDWKKEFSDPNFAWFYGSDAAELV